MMKPQDSSLATNRNRKGQMKENKKMESQTFMEKRRMILVTKRNQKLK